jgi:hypothetical protein
LEDVIEEVKQACSPIKHRQGGFSKKMSSERERRRAAELAKQIEDWQRRWLKDPRGTKKAAFNRIIQKEINARRKELARLMPNLTSLVVLVLMMTWQSTPAYSTLGLRASAA